MNLPEFFGIDLGTHTIKVAQAKIKGPQNAELTAIGQSPTDVNVIGVTNIVDKRKLGDNIKKVKEASGISTNNLVCALPESLIYTRLIMIPDLPDEELEQVVFYEAKQYLPIAPSDTQIDYFPITKKVVDNKTMIQAMLVAAPKSIVNTYVEIAQLAGCELIGLETETMATARIITFKKDIPEGALIIDFGGKGTDVSVVKGKNVIFSQSLGTGSDALTKAIASEFGLDPQQAEQYKRTYGLLENQAEGKIAKTLSPVFQIIINEINKTLNYFRAHLKEGTPSKIFVVGDGAKLPGLTEYLNQHLGIPCELADPVTQLEMGSRIKSELMQLSTVGFTVSVGLALKTE